MTDVVILAAITAIPSTLAAAAVVIGAFNRGTLKQVKTNVDGNLTEIKNQLAIMTALHLQLTADASKAEAISQEKDRARATGDAKYAEGMEAERERNRLRAEIPKG